MKNRATWLVLCLFPVILTAKSGLTVNFKSAGDLNGTNVGIKLLMLNPYIGFDFIHFGMAANYHDLEWDTDYDWNQDQYVFYKNWEMEEDIEVTADLVIPRLGLRFFITDGTLKTYALCELSIIKPDLEVRSKGWEAEFYPDGSQAWRDEWHDEFDLEDVDELDMHGFTLGFGVEYRLHGSTTIGGEFGIRTIQAKVEDSGSNKGGEYDWQWKDEWKMQLESELSGSYTAFSLNYYF